VRLFKNVERYEVVAGDDTIIFPAELTDIQKKVLDLLEMPVRARTVRAGESANPDQVL
jgi:hypothetical protein